MGSGRLYLAVAAGGFRRYATYRVATAAGVFTNTVFGVILVYTYLALWDQKPHLGGYDQAQAVTYVWLGQCLYATLAIQGGGAEKDLMDRIRTGEIAVDRGVLPGDADPAPYPGRFPHQVVPGDPGRTAVRPQQRGQQPHRRGLPGAVGTEDPADRALGHGQVQSAHGPHLAEALLQTFTKYSVRSSHAATIAHYVRCT